MGYSLLILFRTKLRLSQIPVLLHTDEGKEEELIALLKGKYVSGLSGNSATYIQKYTSLKNECREENIPVNREFEKGDSSRRNGKIVSESFPESSFSVLQDVYKLILDRKENPQEGSYINYLLDKGTDKILKKIGEECTDIVIAAKNEDKEEIACEISDLLIILWF